MKLFDCTLRDGANVVGNGFSKELTISMIEGLLACGIEDIEMGNAKGLGAYERGAEAPLTDLEYMELAEKYSGKGRLGMFQLSGYDSPENIRLAADHKLYFLRVGANAGDGGKALATVRQVKEAGLFCRYSQMKAYICTAEELAEEAAMLEGAGVDAITIMDSAGTMVPDQVKEYVAEMKARVSIPVGFHGHSNLGMAQANALAAAQEGADEIDCGLLGMARSAGNCATELAAASLLREGQLEGVDLYGLLAYLDRELIPAMESYSYHVAVSPLDLVLGLTGCHSSFIPVFKRVAEEEGAELYRLIAEVSAADRKKPSEELMRRTAAALKQA